METAIGVFYSRARTAGAVRELLDAKVPPESIVFLTRSESDAKLIGREIGATVGGLVGASTGLSAGVIAAITLLPVPGIGQVFTLGCGAAALLGFFGAMAGSAVSEPSDQTLFPQLAAQGKSSDDATFFREVLKEGRGLIVVRTASRETLSVACEILDRLGLWIRERTPLRMQTACRRVGDITVVDVSGRITLGEENLMLREVVCELLERGNNKILLNLRDVEYIDSAGLGELVGTYTTTRNQGGQLVLLNPSRRMNDLLQMTGLGRVFKIETDEGSAIQSFGRPKEARATA